MVTKQSTKAEAWVLFDRIISLAAPCASYTNSWQITASGGSRVVPDYATLQRLLGVPLYMKAGTQSGVPALALDVWLSYELKRAGFDEDEVWPRPKQPRILPAPVASLLSAVPGDLREKLLTRLSKGSIPGVTSSSASILGKNYLKQVDVIITDWATGPELLISTKRMDSSYGKNAPNRIEESYGDAKNLRLRHPLAALGFVLGLRSDILQKERAVAEWLFDLLEKLGREDDAYHATCLILMEYASDATLPENGDASLVSGVPEPGVEPEQEDDLPVLGEFDVDQTIARLPQVSILLDQTPSALDPGMFLQSMITRVLSATPVNMHREARRRRAEPDHE